MSPRDALAQFARRGEKSAPPVFIGREAILKDIIDRAEEGWKNNHQGEPGHTHIIQGAPGAGKSSIIAELEKILNTDGQTTTGWSKGAPRMVILSGSEVRSPEIVLRHLARLVDAQKAQDLFAEKSKFWKAAVKFNLPVVGAEASRERETTSPAPSATLSLFKEWLTLAKRTLKGPIIIAIDEAQNLPRGKELPSSQFLQDIHENTSHLPISLLLAGLSDTHAHVASLGLTRSLEVHAIGRFTRAESIDLMQKWCAHFGLTVGAQQPRLNAYCQLADDWPRHLHCAQKALAQVLVEKSNADATFTGALDTVTDLEWQRATTQFARYRAEYYRDRVSPEMRTYQPLMVTVMKTVHPQISRTEVLDVVAGDSKQPHFPYYTNDTLDFFNHLVHQGALQEDAEGFVSCPIPSFRTWLMESVRLPSTTYTLRFGGEIYKESTFDSYRAAREWAMKQLDHLKTDQEVTLWQGAVTVEILREAARVEHVKDRAEKTTLASTTA